MAISKSVVKKLRQIYLSEYIIVFLRDMNVVTVSEEQGEVKISAMVEGFVVDIDSEYFYLGLTDGTIMKTVGHDIAQMVEIQVSTDAFMIENMNPDEDIH